MPLVNMLEGCISSLVVESGSETWIPMVIDGAASKTWIGRADAKIWMGLDLERLSETDRMKIIGDIRVQMEKN